MESETQFVRECSKMRTTSTTSLFWTFLRLGCTSFGGPIAHIGYFRTEFVTKRGWMTEAEYADLVGLCQFLPGPASSQVSMGIGYRFGGVKGALAAWLGFTLPSALIMFAAAALLMQYPDWASSSVVHGLKIAAVAIVAHAVVGMSQSLCPDWERRTIAVAVAALLLIIPISMMQLIVIGVATLYGWMRSPKTNLSPFTKPRFGYLAAFFGLLIALPLFPQTKSIEMFSGFYRTGALVFGGGHVVLPLLETETVAKGLISANDFLAGYGVAQALPGPLFTFATYLGAQISGWQLALVATFAIFLASFLLLAGVLPIWDSLKNNATSHAILNYVNAAVVGILAAAWVNPVATTALITMYDGAIAICAFLMLQLMRTSPILIVTLCAIASWSLG